MQLKSFDEFLNTISNDDWNDMLKKAHEVITSNDASTPATQFNDMVLFQTVQLLKRYHEWLSEQFA